MNTPRGLAGWLALLEQRHPQAIELGLERCGAVWRRLDAPRPAPRVFTVAGTNGKGSVVACLDQLLRTLGHRAGTYTSPHLLRFNERVTVEGVSPGDDAWIHAFERVEAARGDTSLTYFEFTTLAALLLLADAGLDAAVLEVGLGGRLDAVNLVDADCAVITPIGLDHQEFLGNDRETIAREKAGILRPRAHAVIGDRDPPASLRAEVERIGATSLWLGRDFDAVPAGGRWVYRAGPLQLDLPAPALPGIHQLDNTAVAITALLSVFASAATQQERIGQALRAARLPGRLQRFGRDPVVWVDVGHNPHAALAVAAALPVTGGPLHCVLAMLRDKDPAGVAQVLDARVSAWHCAPLEGPRGQSAADLAA
ncbi:MAG: folylpolyglutamate synthase/dihydrofolate synthase family protein, partial [Xanthomonadales bacterium]|nr:folylpolyglutamate synthase/dihydrofolate synthase family protein [Xanthomonadales bacterium]